MGSVFEAPRTFHSGTSPADLVLRDVNGDEHLDAIVVQWTGNSVLTMLGGGDGTFAPPVYSLMAGGTDLALADFDGDGHLDVVVPGSPTVVARGDGSGSFTSATEIQGDAKFVAVGDVDADGALDFVTISNTARVHLGDGHGAFASGEPFATSEREPGAPQSVAVVDTDGDAVLDLAVGHLDEETVTISRGNGDGTFVERVGFLTEGGDPWALAFADWNADGRIDVATANDYMGSVSVLLGATAGGFQRARVYPTGLATGALVADDFDRDGNLDVLAAHAKASLGTDGLPLVDGFVVALLRGDGRGEFAEPRPFLLGPAIASGASSWFNLATGDVNEDGLVDVVATNLSEQHLVVLLGARFGTCEPAP